VIAVLLNGTPHPLDAPVSIATLLERLALADRRLAVELNGEIVPRSRHPHTAVADGDRLEIVAAVGGG
jgi:sulfur carrier protein